MFREMRSAEVSALDEMEARFLPWVAAKLTADEYLGWFALAEDGTIAAGAGLWLMEWPPHMLGRADRRGYLLNVYTGARFRRRGLAKVLVEVAVDWCRTNGIDVMVLHATNDNSGIDPKIGKIPALSKPPFSSYNSYKLLDQNKLALDKGKAMPFKLPNGSELQVVFKDVIQPQKPGDPLRYIVTASVVSGGKTVLPLVEVNAKSGEYFFVGGQTYKGGTLLIGLKVN